MHENLIAFHNSLIRALPYSLLIMFADSLKLRSTECNQLTGIIISISSLHSERLVRNLFLNDFVSSFIKFCRSVNFDLQQSVICKKCFMKWAFFGKPKCLIIFFDIYASVNLSSFYKDKVLSIWFYKNRNIFETKIASKVCARIKF